MKALIPFFIVIVLVAGGWYLTTIDMSSRNVQDSSISSISANFAEHYYLSGSSCGSNCMRWTITDLRTGETKDVPFVSENGLAFTPASSIIIENPSENTRESFFTEAITHHWEWDGTTFTRVEAYKINADGEKVSVSPEGDDLKPEWEWNGDCTYIADIGYTVCR